jgi:uncharacterized protein YbaP (TraB family)
MKKEDRPSYEKLVAEGRTIPNARNLFWRIERDRLKPSYLFGTMHVSDPDVLKLRPSVKRAYRGASVVVLETDEVLEIGKTRILALSRPDTMMMPAGKRIEDFLTKEQKDLVNSALTARGAPLSAVNYLRPWLVASIASSACQTARAKAGVPVLDQRLALDAIKAKIPVKGLEKAQEQYNAINRMSLEAQVKGLLFAITSAGQAADVDATTADLYKSGDLRLLAPLLRHISRQDKAMPVDTYAEFEGAVITMRNHVMAERAEPFLRQGNAFIAVGALHLQGEEGLVALLRKQGYRVTPLK